MQRTVHVTELSPVCVTRRRGEDAYAKLEAYLREAPVEIDLDGVDLVSASFLDELVSRLLQSSQIEKVTFVVSESELLEKLGRIAGIRSATIFSRAANESSRQIVPRASVRHESTSVATKRSLQTDDAAQRND